jgi:hypothetical protein
MRMVAWGAARPLGKKGRRQGGGDKRGEMSFADTELRRGLHGLHRTAQNHSARLYDQGQANAVARRQRGLRARQQQPGRRPLHVPGARPRNDGHFKFDVFDTERAVKARKLAAQRGGHRTRARGEEVDEDGDHDHNGPRPIGCAGPGAPVYGPLHVDPTPFAPLTADTVMEEWTDGVVQSYQFLADRCRRLAVSFLSKARWYNAWGNAVVVINAIALSGIVAIVIAEPASQDYIAGVVAAIALLFVIIDQTFRFKERAARYEGAAQQLEEISRNINMYLQKPFDQRSDPFDLSVAIEGKITDVVNQAFGRENQFGNSVFENNINDF